MKKTKILSLLLVALFGASYSSANNVNVLSEATNDENLIVRHVLRQNAANEEGTIINVANAPLANNLVSDVLAQVNVPTSGKISMRFVAGIDTYSYSNAQFNITLKNAKGEVVKAERSYSVSSAYIGVEVSDEVKYAADIFGEGYNYLIAYTLSDIPEDYWNYQFDVTASIGEEGSLTTSENVKTKVALSMLDVNLKVNLFNVDGSLIETRYEKVATNEVYTYNAPAIEGLVASHDYVKGYLSDSEMKTVNIYYSEVDVWDGVSVSESLTGSGTAADPYLIQSGADLAYLKSVVDAASSYKETPWSGKYFKMTKSIDLNGADFMIGYHTGWNAYDGFAGTFDGNNCSVRGININKSSGSTGLFACVMKAGTVKNFSAYGNVVGTTTAGTCIGYLLGRAENVTNYVNVSGKSTVGGIAANAESSSSNLVSCVNYGNITGSSYIVAGIAGSAGHNIDRCINFGTITATSDSGGIGGTTKTTGAITNNINYGTINGTSQLGGIIGTSSEKLENNVNYGSVKGTSYSVGGIVGKAQALVNNCTNYGTVDSSHTDASKNDRAGSGGICGISSFNVTNCTNYGLIKGKAGCGGICGAFGGAVATMSDCVNYGTINGTNTSGGVIGKGLWHETSRATVTKCTNYGEVSCTSYIIGGIFGSFDSTIVSYCDNYGNVTSTGDNVGGIASSMYGTGSEIRYCNNYGEVKGRTKVGGIIQSCNGVLDSCYNYGKVTGTGENASVSGTIETLGAEFSGSNYEDRYGL